MSDGNERVIRQYGGQTWINICTNDLASLNVYTVSYHRNNQCTPKSFSSKVEADNYYEGLAGVAKLMVNQRKQFFKSFGGAQWIDICQNQL